VVSGIPAESCQRIFFDRRWRERRAHHYAYVVENIEATVERLAEQLDVALEERTRPQR
jgi:hypothetical protein